MVSAPGLPPRRRWSFSAADGATATHARRAFRSEIERYAAIGSDFAGAELIFAELLSNVARHAGTDAEVSLGWTRSRAILLVVDTGRGFGVPPLRSLPGPEAEHGRGLALVDAFAVAVRTGNRRGGGAYVYAVLPVRLELG